MNRAEFLKRLKKQLRRLKKTELQKNINDYEELISDMTESGLTEQEAVERIGSPEAAAAEILENTPPENFRKKDPIGRCLIALSVLFLSISLVTEYLTHTFQTTYDVITVIGGADGPTSIFLAGRLGRPFLLNLITAAILILTLAYQIHKLHNKKKK